MNYNHCPICSSTNLSTLKGNYSMKLLSCEECSFIFSEKIPLQKELDDFYDLNDDSRSEYFSPVTRMRYETWLSHFEKFKQTKNLLEVGAGNGFFLEIAKENNWNINGTEVSNQCIEECSKKGIELNKGELENIQYPDNHFDIIVAVELIEHLIDPKSFLKECYRILRPGGLMYITTPNFNSILRYRLKDQYDVISYPNHLMYFTQKTLRKIFEDQGFKTNEIRTTGYSITRQKTSRGQSSQDFVSETSDDEILRRRIEESAFLKVGKYAVNGLLNTFKVGDSLKGWFVK